jgi:hypothetical protein
MDNNKTSSRFDTRQSDLNRVDSINNYRTSSYLGLRKVMFDNGVDKQGFANAAIDFLNSLYGFYRVVKEHGKDEDLEEQIEENLDSIQQDLFKMKHDADFGVEQDFNKFKEIEKELTDVEDLINDLRRDAGLSISQTDNTKEGQELL